MSSPEPDVDSIRKRAEKASEGPWTCELAGGPILYGVRAQDANGVFEIADAFQGEDDAEFIAAARQDIPALLDALATAREERDGAQDHVRGLQHSVKVLAGENDNYRATITQLRGELSRKDSALVEVRDGEQRLSYCGSRAKGHPCLFPQEHSDDETQAEFTNRLQAIARAALSTVETPPET